jgi:hypothetical protein
MLILQYILNLEATTVLTYKGSGTVVISGTAPVVFTPIFEKFLEIYKVGEYVYDVDHNVWQIVAIQGSVENPTYVVQNNGVLKSFYGNEIVKFTRENEVFDLIYQKRIDAYEYNIQVLNEIDSTLPSVTPVVYDYSYLKTSINPDIATNTQFDSNIANYLEIINKLDELYNQ